MASRYTRTRCPVKKIIKKISKKCVKMLDKSFLLWYNKGTKEMEVDYGTTRIFRTVAVGA